MVSLLKNNKNVLKTIGLYRISIKTEYFPKGRVSKFDNLPQKNFFKCGGFGPYEIHRNGK